MMVKGWPFGVLRMVRTTSSRLAFSQAWNSAVSGTLRAGTL